MDETTKAIIDSITVRYSKPTKIPSGDLCTVFYDCIQLSPADLARLAAEATGDLHEGTFEVALGLAYTGILFASAVAGGKQVSMLTTDNKIYGVDVKGKKVVIVDDVVHSGKRLLEATKLVEQAGGIVAGYACIIDRSLRKFGTPSRPLWSAHQTDMS